MKHRIRPIALLVTAALASGPAAAANDERASVEMLKQTTMNLIEALVETGVLPREKADALVKRAEQDAARQVAAAKASAPVRVAYVPDVVKDQIRNELKQEVLAQARAENWAGSTVPSWVERVKIDGDVRVRYQSEQLDSGNAAPVQYLLADMQGLTRGADLGAINSAGYPTANTLDDRNRWRVRMRLGLTAQVTDWVGVGVRLATGNTTDRVSTNQSMGQNFNKYQLTLDRAYVRLDPFDSLSVSAGRIPNPWFSSDLVWDEDLNFEGIAASFKPKLAGGRFTPFVTAGLFPLREDSPPTRDDRWLSGVQVGFDWELARNTRWKFGVAKYNYRNIEGQVDNAYDPVYGGEEAYGKYAYESGLRQKGNTLFRTNSPLDSSATMWGLASKFRPVAVTAALDLAYFDPVHIMLSAEYVKNPGFNRKEIASRTGLTVDDGRNSGHQFRVAVGMPEVREARDWNAFVAYRYLGSDAVLDAFTDSDFGLGGTNTKGYTLGFSYGLARNTALSMRWMSADSIDSPTGLAGDKFAVDVLQLDLSARF